MSNIQYLMDKGWLNDWIDLHVFIFCRQICLSMKSYKQPHFLADYFGTTDRGNVKNNTNNKDHDYDKDYTKYQSTTNASKQYTIRPQMYGYEWW